MAYDEGLAERLHDLLVELPDITSKKMFGGLGFLLNGNMCVGIWKDALIIRVGPEIAERLLTESYVRPFDITGKPMTGWAMVLPEAITEDEQLEKYVDLSVDFVSGLPEK
jgi:TfoX/Sxy family transcriptional regulator of competence genes